MRTFHKMSGNWKFNLPRLLAKEHRGLLIVPLLPMLIAVSLFSHVETVRAHSPHDIIDALELSPAYDEDTTLFVIICDHLLKSTDAGYSWRELVNGLDHKHLLSSIAISPSFRVDRTMFVSSTRDGIYRSEDEGASWVKVNAGLSSLRIGPLAIYPVFASEQIVLAAGIESGLYRTKNGGDSWEQVMPGDITITAVAFFEDKATKQVLAGDQDGNLYLSTNGGQDWQQSSRIRGSGAITAIAVSPSVFGGGSAFIGTEKRGVFRSANGGRTFDQVNNGLSDEFITSLAISSHYETDATIFASGWNQAVFRSNNAGNTWQKYNEGVTSDPQADSGKYRSPHYRDLRISNAFGKDKTVFLGGFDGLFKSTDSGQTWAQMETLPLRLIKGLALSPGDKNNSTVAITTYGGGAYTTDDQGLTWAVNNTGLITTRLSDIVFSPNYASDNTIFSASAWYLLRSTDGGNNWDKIQTIYRSWRSNVIAILRRLRLPLSLYRPLRNRIFTKLEKLKPFATVIALSPNFTSDKTIYFGTRAHGIFMSEDGGLNPSIIWDGAGRTITSLVISPNFSSDGTIFAGVRGAGIYRTVDRGDTWIPANNGLTFVDAWQQTATRHDIHEKDIKLAVSPSYRMDKTLFSGSSAGLFKTTDGGESWQQLESGMGYIIGMGISPNYKNDQTLIISIKGKGLFKSENGGIDFAEIAPDLRNNNHSIEHIQFSMSFAHDKTIYAASDEELFQSIDGGNSWKTINRPVRYENHREVIHYEGEWKTIRGDDYSATRISHSSVANSKCTFTFVGTGITWIGTTSNNQGIAKLYVDGSFVADVDQFSETLNSMTTLYSTTDLPCGPHAMTIEVTNTKNPKSAGYGIEIDAFDIVPCGHI